MKCLDCGGHMVEKWEVHPFQHAGMGPHKGAEVTLAAFIPRWNCERCGAIAIGHVGADLIDAASLAYRKAVA